jgi:hypothetical protein
MRIAVLFGALIAVAVSGSASAASITGAVLFGADGSGGTSNVANVWNTTGGDMPFNLYVKSGSNWVNAGNGGSASLNIPLSPGEYTVGIFGDPGLFPQSYAGLNVFFDGSNSAPGISVFIPENSFSSTGGNLTPDSNVHTRGLAAYTFDQGAGTLLFSDGDLSVKLTGFSWYDPNVRPNPNDKITASIGDYVSGYDNHPDFFTDYRGYVTISVAAPEPASLGMIGAGLIALGAARRLSRRRS